MSSCFQERLFYTSAKHGSFFLTADSIRTGGEHEQVGACGERIEREREAKRATYSKNNSKRTGEEYENKIIF